MRSFLSSKIELLKSTLRSLNEPSGLGLTMRSGGGLSKADFMESYTKTKSLLDDRGHGANFFPVLHRLYMDTLEDYAGGVIEPALRSAAGGDSASAKLKSVGKRIEELALLDRWLIRLAGSMGGGGAPVTGGVMSDDNVSKAPVTPLRGAGPAPALRPALKVFKEACIRHVYEPSQASILGTLLEQFTAERNGEAVDRATLKSVVDMFKSYGHFVWREATAGAPAHYDEDATFSTYVKDVHEPFVASAALYYEGKVAEWLSKGVSTYIAHVNEAIAKERANVAYYMPFLTEESVLHEVQRILLVLPQKAVLESPTSGVAVMLGQVFDMRGAGGAGAGGADAGGAREGSDAPPTLTKQQDLRLLFTNYCAVKVPRPGHMFKPSGGALPQHASASQASASAAAAGAEDAAQKDFTLRLLKPMADIFAHFVKDKGEELLRTRSPAAPPPAAAAVGGGAGPAPRAKAPEEATDNPEFSRQLLDLHRWCMELVRGTFGNHLAFAQAAADVWRALVNALPPGSSLSNSVVLTHFMDRVQRNADKQLEPAQKAELAACVGLFQFEKDKDVVQAVYAALLSKRLLRSGKQAASNMDLERFVLAEFKTAFGGQYTNKMEVMLNDVTAPGPVPPRLKARGERLPFELSVQVLTSGNWPAFVPISLALPPGMEDAKAAFEKWYVEVKGNRKLLWCPTVGSCTITANYEAPGAPGGYTTYDFTMANPIQAAVLLLFSNPATGALTVDGVVRALNCSNREAMRRILHSLACGKARALRKTPETSSIKDDDTFAYNAVFAHSLRVVPFPCPSLEETHDAKKVEENREHSIDAAIVRIMKARKTLTVTELQGEVMKQLSIFKPTAKACVPVCGGGEEGGGGAFLLVAVILTHSLPPHMPFAEFPSGLRI